MMLNIALPEAGPCGWGQVGIHVRRELRNLNVPFREIVARDTRMEGPLLQALLGPEMAASVPFAKPTGGNYGYCFFEMDGQVKANIWAGCLERYDHVFCGSKWNEQALCEASYGRCSTVIQGVDHEIFRPGVGVSFKELQGKYVVFSGGKFELRKGQDIALVAFQEFARRHVDAHLLAAWWNPWAVSERTMEASKLIDYRFERGQVQLIADMGLTDRIHLLNSNLTSNQMRDCMQASDLAIFPNRAEGGTNLVLMESMACGLPCIATAKTGQSDVLGTWALCLEGGAKARINEGATWWEPDPAELLDGMEWAYSNRAQARDMGRAAAAASKAWTWRATTETFLKGMGVSYAC